MKKSLISLARKLRGEPTDAESYLWYVLRLNNLGVKFRRQAQIGHCIVDFVCFDRKLVIEIDGGQHANSLKDKHRDKWLASQGFKILRFWNNEVLANRDGVVEVIQKAL
ncbi:MAG: DUF559 domain-containing protein [bacterium]|nr:DUF559 domain-containing protein [bacterium]